MRRSDETIEKAKLVYRCSDTLFPSLRQACEFGLELFQRPARALELSHDIIVRNRLFELVELLEFARFEVIDDDRDEQVQHDEGAEQDEAYKVNPRPWMGTEYRVHHVNPTFERHQLEKGQQRSAERSPVLGIVAFEEVEPRDCVNVEDDAHQHDDVAHARDRAHERGHYQTQLRDG